MQCIKVAQNIYFRSNKIFNQYQVLINRKDSFFSRVYPTLEEAIKGRNEFYLEHKLTRGLREDH